MGGRTLSHSFRVCSTASSFRSPAERPLTSLLPLESASQSAQNGTMFHSTTCVPNTAPTAVASRFHVLEMRIPPRVCDLRRAWGHVHERISIPEWHTLCSDGAYWAGTGHTLREWGPTVSLPLVGRGRFALAQVPAEVQSCSFEVAPDIEERFTCGSQASSPRTPTATMELRCRLPTDHPAGKLGGVNVLPHDSTSFLRIRRCTDTGSAHKRGAIWAPVVLDEAFVVRVRLAQQRRLGPLRRRCTCSIPQPSC